VVWMLAAVVGRGDVDSIGLCCRCVAAGAASPPGTHFASLDWETVVLPRIYRHWVEHEYALLLARMYLR